MKKLVLYSVFSLYLHRVIKQLFLLQTFSINLNRGYLENYFF